uniref:Uncharacterized protein n=1 Tax=Rhizophora mucronata TaxID=61149 RepID=A0A2P2PLW1_RHIMU
MIIIPRKRNNHYRQRMRGMNKQYI